LKNTITLTSLVLLFSFLLISCGGERKTLDVTATAYNSVNWQTKPGNPALAAWGDTLEPGMKAIAVSRDLIDSGLVHNTKVKIKGLDGTYLVKDKMNKRWRMKIDIYMGVDVEKAREWGKKKVTISWVAKPEDEVLSAK
jgi:3D (Asp-Asp-Asp) domain-containing protein